MAHTVSNWKQFKFLLIIVLLQILPAPLYAQSYEHEYSKAIAARLKGQFKTSDSLFKHILKNHRKNLPEELCYHYGVVLLQLKDSVQAKNFLHKYLSFKKNNHKYKDSSIHYLHLMDVQITTPARKTTSYVDTCDLCLGRGISKQSCHKCSGSGKVLCYLCRGTGLLGNANEMGTATFNECHICKGQGSMACALCKGEKTIVDTCLKCNGKGKVIIDK
ncbi:MAG TPA: hypothetical protein VL947_13220 [Cytophagales bacterium]|nr:hypothetical protein [Cytophagales bacterium]